MQNVVFSKDFVHATIQEVVISTDFVRVATQNVVVSTVFVRATIHVGVFSKFVKIPFVFSVNENKNFQ